MNMPRDLLIHILKLYKDARREPLSTLRVALDCSPRHRTRLNSIGPILSVDFQSSHIMKLTVAVHIVYAPCVLT